jgi:hypothetical protein
VKHWGQANKNNLPPAHTGLLRARFSMLLERTPSYSCSSFSVMCTILTCCSLRLPIQGQVKRRITGLRVGWRTYRMHEDKKNSCCTGEVAATRWVQKGRDGTLADAQPALLVYLQKHPVKSLNFSTNIPLH